MPMKNPGTASNWIDPDDAPKLTREWFERAEIHDGGKLVRRGRPPKAEGERTVPVTLRMDPDVLEHFRATGPGWHNRMKDALRKAAGL